MAANLPPSVAVQQQVRANAQELNDFLRGFTAWQRDITKKDKQLIQASTEAASNNQIISTTSNGDVPDGGGHTTGARRVSSPPLPCVPSPLKVDNSARPSSSKNLGLKVVKNLTFAEEENSSTTEDTKAESFSQALIQKQEASAEKDRGNEHFKAGRYDQAIESYTRGIKADPTNAILPANRAMALLKKGRHKEAEADCTLAVSLDPTYVKAYQRRATARASLKDFAGAVKDFEKVLTLEPSNKQAKAEVCRLKTKMLDEEEKNKAAAVSAEPKKAEVLDVKENLKAGLFKGDKTLPGQVFPVEKKPHMRSTKPLRRIEITEVNSKESDITSKDVVSTKRSDGDFLIRESKTTTITNANPSQPKKSKIQIVEVSAADPPASSTSSSSSLSPPKSRPTTTSSASKSHGQVRKVEEQINLQSAKQQQAACQGTTVVKSSMAFYTAWKGLASWEDKFRFLEKQMASAKAYPALFNHSLEAQVFEDMVDVLHQASSSTATSGSTDLSRHLVGLSNVPRMSAMVMFMDNGAKLKELVDKHVMKNEQLDPSQTESVKKCFM